MQTERQYREREELKSVDDYINEIYLLIELASEMDGLDITRIEKSINILMRGIEKKEKYKCKISRPWYRRQSFLSRLLDKRMERRQHQEEMRAQEEDEEDDDSLVDKVEEKDTSLLPVETEQNELMKF